MKNIYLVLIFTCAIVLQGVGQNSYSTFDGNNVEAQISSQGNHFFDGNSPLYRVPASGNAMAVFCSAMWIGAMDNDSNLYLAAERFRQNGLDFFPGPVGDSSSYVPPLNGSWNRLWKVSRYEVQAWLSDPNNVPVPQVVLDWPAHGNTSLGQAANLAPFVDANNDGVYNPADLDHPVLRGDQMVYFIYNDDMGSHQESGGQKLKVEIHGMAYGFNCPEDTALNHALFFNYRIINRSARDYNNMYIALWNDFDVGNAQDDYIGCDPLRNLFFAYNGDNDDQDQGGAYGYGTNLASIGLRILSGIQMEEDQIDNDASIQDATYNGFGMDDGIIDNERLGLSRFLYHNNASGPLGDPMTAENYYNFMQGTWKDGTPMSYGGIGYDPSNQNALLCRYMLPDSSDSVHLGTQGFNPGSYWSESTAGNVPGDRRGVGSMGPVNLDAGKSLDFDFVYVFAQAEGNRLAAVHKMKEYSDQIQDMFDQNSTPCGSFIVDSLNGTGNLASVGLKVFPNPASDVVQILGSTSSENYELLDLQGRVVAHGIVAHGISTINVASLTPGMYLLKIKGNHTEAIVRLVKEH